MNGTAARGLTIVEVLVALVILGVGVMAAAQLQATSLRFTSQAELIKTSTQVAKSEVEWRRQTELTTGSSLTCASSVPEGYTCEVDIVPCNAVGSPPSLTCAPLLVNPVAYKITVEVGGDRIEPFILSTVTTGAYVTGVIGTGEIATEPTTPADPPTTPEEPGEPGAPDPRPCVKWHPKKKDVCQQWGN